MEIVYAIIGYMPSMHWIQALFKARSPQHCLPGVALKFPQHFQSGADISVLQGSAVQSLDSCTEALAPMAQITRGTWTSTALLGSPLPTPLHPSKKKKKKKKSQNVKLFNY